MPWDRVYLGRWFAFLKQIAARYGDSPAFRAIGTAGPTSVSDEMTLPTSREAVAKWFKDGYTPARYTSAWDEVFRVYADLFPNQCITLTAPQLPILQGGSPGGPEFMREKHEVVERAARVFGGRLTVQSNDLHAGRAPLETFDGTDFINGYSGRIITGFEMRGGSRGAQPSKVMGAEDDPPLALRRSIDKGMTLNRSGHHVNYLEIYKGDVLAPDMQPVLKYGASFPLTSFPGRRVPACRRNRRLQSILGSSSFEPPSREGAVHCFSEINSPLGCSFQTRSPPCIGERTPP